MLPLRAAAGMTLILSHAALAAVLFGLYVALGNHTCSHKMPGSYGHIALDAKTLASWDIDLLKVDTCVSATISLPSLVQGLSQPGYHSLATARRLTRTPTTLSATIVI